MARCSDSPVILLHFFSLDISSMTAIRSITSRTLKRHPEFGLKRYLNNEENYFENSGNIFNLQLTDKNFSSVECFWIYAFVTSKFYFIDVNSLMNFILSNSNLWLLSVNLVFWIQILNCWIWKLIVEYKNNLLNLKIIRCSLDM